MGDWDQDGLQDLGFVEDNAPVVRSSRDGKAIASGPRGTYFGRTVDVDGDGRLEIAFYSSSAEIRLVTYDTGSSGSIGRPDLIRKIDRPLEAVPDPGAQQYFDDAAKPKDTPGFDAALVAVALLGAGLVLGRRRKED